MILIRTRYFLIGLICLTLTGSCSLKNESQPENELSDSDFQGIRGSVYETETGKALPARIAIKDTSGTYINSYYEKAPGFFTGEDGSFELNLAPGKYEMEVFHGIDRLSQKVSFEVSDKQGVDANIYLPSWIDLKEKGWVNGDGHCHLYTEIKPDTAMAALVRRICRAQGVDFVCAAQGWAGYNDSTWEKGYEPFTDEKFILHYGSEMPKYRTGHTWWLGQTSTMGYYWNSMDTAYENQYYQSYESTHWSFDNLGFPAIPDVEIVQGLKMRDNSVAIMAHPTSWWWQERGAIEKYTSNVVSYLSFGLLAGQIWDGLVVMGYNHDHIFYQNLWFHILNLGYQMPAIGELDGGINQGDRFYYGSMRTYFKVGADFSIANVAEAVRKGRTFVTSGPIIQTNIDNAYEIGDVIPLDNRSHKMNLNVLASGKADDYLSWVIVYRNGQVYKVWDVRADKTRKFNNSIELKETENAWYVVKAYGAKAVDDPKDLNIMDLCVKKEHMDFPDFSGDSHDVCITSPFYFREVGTKPVQALISQVNLKLYDPSTGEEIENAEINTFVQGQKISSHTLKDGALQFEIPIHALLKIKAQGYPEITRCLYLDYPPHLELLEELASGDWRNSLKDGYLYHPGEIPWEAFHYEKTKEVLSHVNWMIEMKPNVRDGLWEQFEGRFK